MSFKKFAMNVVTLGGHDQLEAAKSTYEAVYQEYEGNRNKLFWLTSTRDDHLSDLGELVITTFKAAKSARRMLRKEVSCKIPPSSEAKLVRSEALHTPSLTNVDRVIADYTSSVGIAGGAGAGAAAAAGSWSLVALVGSASTGTAISTLSGVAATNATLAWFGGGALAAGGAGMAGGTLVLGGVALVPVLAVAAWHSRSKVKEINHEVEKVRHANLQVNHAIGPTQKAIKLIDDCLDAVRPSATALQWELEAAKEALFPVWGLSIFKRWIARLFRRPFYSASEEQVIVDLESALIEFVTCFHRLQIDPGDSENRRI
ncbi:hypothetical protein [Novosphingobium sp. 11B]